MLKRIYKYKGEGDPLKKYDAEMGIVKREKVIGLRKTRMFGDTSCISTGYIVRFAWQKDDLPGWKEFSDTNNCRKYSL